MVVSSSYVLASLKGLKQNLIQDLRRKKTVEK